MIRRLRLFPTFWQQVSSVDHLRSSEFPYRIKACVDGVIVNRFEQEMDVNMCLFQPFEGAKLKKTAFDYVRIMSEQRDSVVASSLKFNSSFERTAEILDVCQRVSVLRSLTSL